MPSTYLSRTPASAGSATTWTVSFWLKRSGLGQQGFFGTYPNGNTRFGTDSNDAIDFYDNDGSFQWRLVTNRLFRDVSAWYHFVVQVDTTNATSSDRVKLYVNGVRETSFSTATYPSQNFAGADWNDNGSQYIGTHSNEYMNGCIAQFNNIDGQALTPSSFGETDATTGIWKPKSYSGSYGTNGFFLKFENSGSLGTDSSGNGNNFTVNGTPTQTVDTPSNVFCTLNPLDGLPSGSGGGATVTYSNGNTRSDSRYGAGEYPLCRGNMFVNKGKWYWEAKVDTTGIGLGAGVRSETANGGDFRGGETFYGAGFSGHTSSATFEKYDNSGSISIATDVSNGGGVIGYALDLDNGTFAIYYNGTLQGTDTTLPSNNSVYFYPVSGGTNSGGNSWSPISFNFGNGYFATTAISSPYADGAGLGKFQYQPPTGYYSLCTKNINVYG